MLDNSPWLFIKMSVRIAKMTKIINRAFLQVFESAGRAKIVGLYLGIKTRMMMKLTI